MIPSKLEESAYEPGLSFEQTHFFDDLISARQNSLDPQMQELSDELVKLMETKMRRLIAVQEEHARKVSLERTINFENDLLNCCESRKEIKQSKLKCFSHRNL